MKNKYQNLTYQECVERGIEFLQNIKNTKYEICLLTTKVCDIRIGGHGRDKEIYSMKKFADDIGMKHHTLKKWMEEHRNVVEKLPKKPKAKDYKIIRQVLKEVTNKTPTKEVREIYNHYQKYTDDDFKLLAAIKYAKSVRNFVSDYKMELFDQDLVDELQLILNKANDNLMKNRRSKVVVKKSDKVVRI